MAVNMNKWATEITKREGKKVNLTVAQVKEVMRLILVDMKEMSLADISALLAKVKKSRKKVKKSK